MLQDAYARRFTYLRLSLTESCNFRCDYCLPDGPDCTSRRHEINLDEIRRVVTAFALLGTRKVRLTGGEPCLRRDLCDVIRTVKSVPGIEEVAMTTNGYRIQRDLDAWIDAGLDAINVSIDSLDPATFHLITGQNKLVEILDGIDQATRAGLKRVKINTVLLREYNGGELNDFLNYVKRTPVSLRFIELMQTGDNHDYYQRHHISGQSIKERLLTQGWSQCIKHKTAGPAQEFIHPDYAGSMGLIMPYSKDFCADCNRLRVSSRGALFLCLFADAHISLRDLMQSDDPEPLIARIRASVQGKKVSHFLHDKQTGSTKNLAIIGG